MDDTSADFVDADEDGHYSNVDCDDDDPEINPGAEEICGDGLDNDCDGSAGICAYEGAVGLRSSWAVYTGDAEEHQAGISAVEAGDVDGDGVGDLAVGAWARDGEYVESGAVYLITQPVPGVHDLGDVASAIVEGSENSENIGWALASAGDLNGDGISDLLVGTADAHQAYVLNGPITESGQIAHMGHVWAHTAGSFAGTAVAGVSDATGDGVPDVLIGAWSDDKGAVDAGGAFLLAGPVTGSGLLSNGIGVFVGIDAGGDAGRAVGDAGDVDGDGISDLVIGAPGLVRDGEAVGGAYVFLGPISGSYSMTDADVTLQGNAVDGEAGLALAADRDLNGDGLKDLAIGAPAAGVDIYGTGAVYVVQGPLESQLGLENAQAVIWGEAWDDQAGVALSAPGDLDGDLIGDLLVGADGVDEPYTTTGRTYVVLGPLSGASSLAAAAAWYEGPVAHAHTGAALDRAGDVNGDGVVDFLIGAYLVTGRPGQ